MKVVKKDALTAEMKGQTMVEGRVVKRGVKRVER